jgi:MFS transporter, BCD family, chlorophyll transporter
LMFVKRFQLALIHMAVAMTLVPINSTLNRVMIKELALSATLVAVLASLPYIFSPLQVVIGSYSDRHPVFGLRRTPYIVLGLLLCTAGVGLAPLAVFFLPGHPGLGLLLSLLTFGAWGMGFNVASVSYLSLASELSGEKGRSRTVSVMWFVMIAGIIATSIALGRLLETYTPQTLENAFLMVAGIALGLGLLGLVRLEPRSLPGAVSAAGDPKRAGWQGLIRGVLANPQARHFFFYLIILLAAILGQDVLLEPYAGETFHLPVAATTRITSIWGMCVLVALLAAGWLEGRLSKRGVARLGAIGAIAGFMLIAGAGLLGMKSVFYTGVLLLGLGTGFSTTSNLSLMLDMTTARVGLFIGAWGVADALARLVGTLLAGVGRDVFSYLTGVPVVGYILVFVIQAILLVLSLVMLARIDVGKFKEQTQINLADRTAMMNDAT